MLMVNCVTQMSDSHRLGKEMGEVTIADGGEGLCMTNETLLSPLSAELGRLN